MDSPPPDAKFSFFVTSIKALRELSGSQNGFGGDLRFGETGPGAGLRGADKLCATIAERSMAGAGAKTWRAFLSAASDGAGTQVNAIDRIGNGPWYDRLGRLFAPTKADLMSLRPLNGDPAIRNDFPNEDGVPNHNPDGTGQVDNHDMLTGSNAAGNLYGRERDLPRLDRERGEQDARRAAARRPLVAARRGRPDRRVDLVAHRVGLRARRQPDRDRSAGPELEHGRQRRRLRGLLLLRTPAVRSPMRPTILAACALVAACGDDDQTGDDGPGDGPQVVEGACQIADPASPPDDLRTITCKGDFSLLGALPIDATLPSATSLKVVLDRLDSENLYFQNTKKYQIHYQFCSKHLSGNGLPIVPDLATFNSTEYFSPDRRFVLGAVTYYALPDKWVLELSPYDTADADLIAKIYRKVARAAYFGPQLAFHPTSEALAAVAATLPDDIRVITTDELYAGIDYQPLALGVAVGTLHFTTVASLAAGEYVSPLTILVLDSAPNDLSVVQGTITQDFQTPLSHINVLAHTRKIPNMGLRGALSNATLLGFADQLVKLTATADTWTVEAISAADAQAYWEAHAPVPVTLPAPDLSATALADVAAIVPNPTGTQTLIGNLQAAMRAYGGKTAHYAVLYNTPGVPIRKAFGIPIYYYDKFMRDNGFFTRVAALLADPTFRTDPTARAAALAQLRTDLVAAPFDPELSTALAAKVAADYAGVSKLKFRSSSNSEDLSGFPCAGCYDSFAGKVADLADMALAIKKVWASVWTFRAFELRSYYGVAHASVGMALLCHQNFPDEAANGVAITSNPFDANGLDPALYVNVQVGGDVEVVSPPPGVASDQFLYYFSQPNQPISFITHSSLISPGKTVLTTAQTYELGQALAAIHQRFSPLYGPGAGNNGWYAMDVEFKFDNGDNPSAPPRCYVKQARPYADPHGGLP